MEKEKVSEKPIPIKFKPSTRSGLDIIAEEKDRAISYIVREIIEKYLPVELERMKSDKKTKEQEKKNTQSRIKKERPSWLKIVPSPEKNLQEELNFDDILG